MIDPITDDDLIAFVDEQIDPMRRLDVEAHLAADPAAAARVMAEMHDRDALRACFERVPGPGPDRTVALARRFDRNQRWRRVASRLKRAAAIAVLVGAGWLAHDEIGRFGVPDTLAATPDPALIADARQARAVAQLRKSISGQADGPVYDRTRLRSVTGIDLPALPEGWRVRDIQIFPARHGTGIEIALEAGAYGEASLFATRGIRGGPATLTGSEDGDIVSWNAGDTAYALIGPRDDLALQQAAGLLGAVPAAR
ncbi:Transmembrane transcriptional regulator (anti-sigma factor RsiW) [Methylobacterium phyllostachyos]|uniref:Transmembrane transcriptional regulator (Anti-sigma factor RsiW) n=1 Tax=Methylobacterium phyllostachyos TaxID=582672 RepID=A0A1H0H5K6_9HYPH|nr:anti-sigma factor [Methylobacterium phyllostachyos]SDO14412.1 Transmembrane transcriptional regulator (anti-sigma factor RsiW) [Methylobacterium phyllostachyos]